MIVELAAAAPAVVAAVRGFLHVRGGVALPLSAELRAWNREARALVQAQLEAGEDPATCYAYRYAWAGDVGDHDNKVVWRVHPTRRGLGTYIADVSADGRRVGPARRVLIR